MARSSDRTGHGKITGSSGEYGGGGLLLQLFWAGRDPIRMGDLRAQVKRITFTIASYQQRAFRGPTTLVAGDKAPDNGDTNILGQEWQITVGKRF